MRAAQGAHHRQPVQLRHLLIQKNHVRVQIQDPLQRLFAGGRLARDFQLRDRFHVFAQDLARHRLVVGDQDFHRHASTGRPDAEIGRAGIRTLTSVPEALDSMVRRASPP